AGGDRQNLADARAVSPGVPPAGTIGARGALVRSLSHRHRAGRRGGATAWHVPRRDPTPARQSRGSCPCAPAGDPRAAPRTGGERAPTEGDLQKFFNEVVTTVGEILDVEMAKILELVPGDAELLLRAGIGWHARLVGTANVSTGRDTQAGYTLASGRPVIVEDLASETSFTGAPL